MATVDKDIERLIVRHLDGELTAEEELELNRELIRDPEARRMMEDYQRIDDLAGTTLKHVIVDNGVMFDPAMLTSSAVPSPCRRRHTGYLHALWIIPGAIAAALLALVIPNPFAANPRSGKGAHMVSKPALPPVLSPDVRSGVAEEIMRPVSHGSAGPRIRRDTGRNVFGVVGEDGNIYWIQVDRIRTLKRPSRPSGGQASNDIM